jgi:hypothetical protein
MSQARLTKFLTDVKGVNKDFSEQRSSLKGVLALMRQQVTANNVAPNSLTAAITTARRDKRAGKYQTLLVRLETTWGQPEIQYKGPGQANYSPLTGRLFVLLGTTLTVRHVETNATQTLTFNTRSTSNSDAGQQTATARFGTHSYAVNAIVYELQAKVVFEDNFAGRSTTDVGVDERVTLDFDTVPAGLTATQIGGLRWGFEAPAAPTRKTHGVVQKSKTDPSAPATDGKAFFVAPYTTDGAYPLSPRPSGRSRDVTLAIEVTGGPSAGKKVNRKFTVHAPQCRMVKTTQELHVAATPSAGFIGEVYFDPKNVSFKTLLWREGRGTFVARQTGFPPAMTTPPGALARQLPASPSGYFAFENGKVHQSTIVTSGGAIPILGGNSGTGCKLNGSDRVYSGYNTLYPAPFDGTTFPHVKNGLATNAPSEMKWPINWLYKPVDLPDTEYVVFQQAVHEATMDAQGTVTIKKAGAQAIKRLADPQEWV